jgi:hypothetical protein
MVEGDAPLDVDLAVCEGDSGYLVSLTNLRSSPREIRLRVRLKDQDMGRWKSRSILGSPVREERSADSLLGRTDLEPLASVVFLLEDSAATPGRRAD